MTTSFDRFIDAVERRGFELRRCGEEYFARGTSCAECGSEGAKASGDMDRVRLFPIDRSVPGRRRGRWFCHHCGASGDGVDFLMRYCGEPFPEAFRIVTGENPPDRPLQRKRNGKAQWRRRGIEQRANKEDGGASKPERSQRGAGIEPRMNAERTPEKWQKWQTRRNPLPCPAWQAKAAVLCCELDHRWNDFGAERIAEARRWIEEGRGIRLNAAPVLGIYWNPADRFEDPALWGLKRERKLFIPRGIVIALHRRTLPPWEASPWIAGLLVRRAEPSSEADKLRWVPFRDDGAGHDLPRIRTMVLGLKGMPVVVMESALDAALVFQECGATVAVVATCGATYPLDEDAAEFLRSAPRAWAWPDADDAGMDAFRRWKKAFPCLELIEMPKDGEGRPWAKDATGLVPERRRRPSCPTVRQILAGAGAVAED